MKSLAAAIPAWGLAIIFILVSSSGSAQQCSKRTTLAADSDVFENPPTFITGSGWRGNIQDRLSGGTAVYICRQTRVDFGFSSKIWVQIAYRSGAKWPVYGWVLNEALKSSAAAPERSPYWARLISAADAQTPSGAEAHDDSELPPPPAIPALVPSATTSSVVGSTGTSSDLVGLYVPLFVAMVLGMCAKVLVDLLDTWDKGLFWGHLRNGVIAILVSPIVFLGLLTAGQFTGNTQTFIVLALLAFQNGFFWQTVLKRESDRTGDRTILPARRGAR